MPLMSRYEHIGLKGSDTVNENDQESQSIKTRALESWRFTTSCCVLARKVSVAGGICVLVLSFSIFMRFPSGMPLSGCCTASIAAACRPWKQDDQQFDIELEKEAITLFSDASFADNLERQSFEGYICTVFGGPVDWRAGKQRTVTTSTTEAELERCPSYLTQRICQPRKALWMNTR